MDAAREKWPPQALSTGGRFTQVSTNVGFATGLPHWEKLTHSVNSKHNSSHN